MNVLSSQVESNSLVIPLVSTKSPSAYDKSLWHPPTQVADTIEKTQFKWPVYVHLRAQIVLFFSKLQA